ncbi:MAG: hypothetical protein ACOC8K_00200 [Gemmatimonadota bacterium]
MNAMDRGETVPRAPGRPRGAAATPRARAGGAGAWTILVIGLFVLPGAAWVQAAPTAVVIVVEGSVQVESGGAPPVEATVGTRLSTGDRVLPESGSRAVLIERGGNRIEVTEASTVRAPSSGGGAAGDGDMFSRTVQVLGQVAGAETENLMDRQGMIRPIPGEPVLVSPRNQLAIMSSRPRFVWRPVDGAAGYTVQIRTPGSEPLRFTGVRDSTWTYPEAAPVLVPGTEYWWTVAPAGSGRAAREQRFRVIDADEYERVTRDLANLEELGLDPWDEGAFLTAVLFADAGLYYDAAGALEFLEDSGISLGADAYLLKGELLIELGDAGGARKAFEAADRMRR